MANQLSMASGNGVLITDDIGNILFLVAPVPTDGDSGYAHGCICIDTGGGGDHQDLYSNISTPASANFNLITVAQG